MEDALAELVAAVRRHYEAENALPLLLSSFGQRHPVLLSRLKEEYGSLKRAIGAVENGELRLIEVERGKEAVATAAVAEPVERKLQQDGARMREGATAFDGLPHSVRVAFCVRTEAGECVALEVTPPFRYSKTTPPHSLRSNQRLVPDELRSPGLALKGASAQDREVLWRKFLVWTERENVDPASFHHRGEHSNALSRLIAAQSKDVIPRLVIPADIAEILLRHS